MSYAQLAAAAIQFVISYNITRATTPDGPRLTSSQITNGDYGAVLPRIYGEAVALGGTVLAAGPLIETEHEQGEDNWFDQLMDATTGILLPDPNYYTYKRSFAVSVADRTDDDPIENVSKIWFNGELVFDADDDAGVVIAEEFDSGGGLKYRRWTQNNGGLYKSITVYGGGMEQAPDPLVSQWNDNTPGYLGTAYIVVENLELARYSNSLPGTMRILAHAKTGETLATVINSIVEAGGIDAEHDLSTTAFTDYTVRGYSVESEITCWDAAAQLLVAHRCDMAEVGGQLRGYIRDQSMRAVIPMSDMAAHAFGTDRPPEYSVSHDPDVGLPREVSVTTLDPDRDYQPSTSSAARVGGAAKSNVSRQIALTQTADERAELAEMMLWDAWLGRKVMNFTVTDQWISLFAGGVYGVETSVGVRPCRLVRKTRGANGLIECEAVSDEGVVYRSTATGDAGVIPDNPAPPIASAVPTAPTGLFGTGGYDTALVTWDENPEAEVVIRYEVYRAAGTGAAFGSAVLVGSVTIDSWAEGGLGVATGYTYFVKAVNGVGASPASVGVDVTTNAADEADIALLTPDGAFFLLPDGGHLILP